MKPAAVLHLCVSVCVCGCHSSHDTLILQQQWKAPEAPALSFSACRMLQAKFRFRFNHSVPQAILMKWDSMMSDRWRKWNSYQTANATQCVIGLINRVSQLVNAIVDFTVSIETHAHRWTVRKTNQGRTTVYVTNSFTSIKLYLMLRQTACWRFETFKGEVCIFDQFKSNSSYEIKDFVAASSNYSPQFKKRPFIWTKLQKQPASVTLKTFTRQWSFGLGPLVENTRRINNKSNMWWNLMDWFKI